MGRDGRLDGLNGRGGGRGRIEWRKGSGCLHIRVTGEQGVRSGTYGREEEVFGEGDNLREHNGREGGR